MCPRSYPSRTSLGSAAIFVQGGSERPGLRDAVSTREPNPGKPDFGIDAGNVALEVVCPPHEPLEGRAVGHEFPGCLRDFSAQLVDGLDLFLELLEIYAAVLQRVELRTGAVRKLVNLVQSVLQRLEIRLLLRQD